MENSDSEREKTILRFDCEIMFRSCSILLWMAFCCSASLDALEEMSSTAPSNSDSRLLLSARHGTLAFDWTRDGCILCTRPGDPIPRSYEKRLRVRVLLEIRLLDVERLESKPGPFQTCFRRDDGMSGNPSPLREVAMEPLGIIPARAHRYTSHRNLMPDSQLRALSYDTAFRRMSTNLTQRRFREGFFLLWLSVAGLHSPPRVFCPQKLSVQNSIEYPSRLSDCRSQLKITPCLCLVDVESLLRMGRRCLSKWEPHDEMVPVKTETADSSRLSWSIGRSQQGRKSLNREIWRSVLDIGPSSSLPPFVS